MEIGRLPAPYVQKAIFTFGYGNRKDHADLERYIKEHGIAYIVDVRRMPRAWGQLWYAEQLLDFCRRLGVDYVSKTALGNTSKNEHWIPFDWAKAEVALSEVGQFLADGSVLLLCAELDHRRCHRTGVAETLNRATDVPVKHLV
ncbi:DUF488 domain-containing protein [Gloeobacter morelensis]|uniref:DUF488 domain-containing protein n=1 Tax=Gloeobacter morelensis MG652769 TaxID=2781736 RepID=A0ABY3PQ57_9CYAN|nr:DUF488 domain-containing protein [Gloeobacter morelensis]UFP95821.1 DUF488 domain-containing protein [Gloeobacter morelensis MG652769]